ncbi:hypothetical protein PV326_014028 [Microctonus aethiopoides]|nr:hypothetical protein PV326_014028 [Microctonus aethiopoides]
MGTISQKIIKKIGDVHIKTILTPIYNKLGFDELKNETHYDKLLRKTIINWACEFEIEDCIDKSLKLFKNWKSDKSKLVPVNIRSTIYCTAIKYGTDEDYDFLWNKYLTTDNPAEKNVIINALGCSKNPSRLEIFLMSAINTKNSPFRSQDIGSVFSSVYTAGIFGAQSALNFTIAYYEHMYNYFGNYDDVADIIGSISAQLSTKELVLQLQEFVETNSINFTTAAKSLDLFVTRAHEELTWYDNNIPRIFEWLDTTYKSSDYRLPKSINPIAYTIFLSPNLENDKFTFDGSVNIQMNVNENITSIVLHANELTINDIYDIEVKTDEKKLDVSNYSINSLTEKLTIYLTTTVNAATVLELSIQYSGKLNNKMMGFYRSSYEDDNGTVHWLASTQFQKYGARQAFPCFDEPSFKAKFTVNIERPNHYHTLSNMPLRVHGLSDKVNHTWDYYMESERMSSYLVAFIVSDFAYLSNENENFKVWSRPNAIEFAKNALDIGQKALRFLEKYTGINYPLPKMDFAAIPDFAAGAMENWGLVTFSLAFVHYRDKFIAYFCKELNALQKREYGLLASENITSAVYMRYMATTIAHELVHMWFGDLVTCDWWEYVWLNEGFAEYLEYLVIDSIYPEWNMEQHFISYELQTALLKDSFPHMRAMNNKMKTPYDEGKDFTSVAYAKSASVIHMMHRAFGNEIFARGLHTYLHKNKYKTGKPEYLWSALQFHVNQNGGLNTTNVSVATLMDSWASQPGYPVVHANLSRTLLTLTQTRFLVTGKNDTNNTQLYWVPITIASKSNPNFNNLTTIEWFGKRKQRVYREDFNRNEWFILNVQQSGYYRVNYEVDNWNKLIKALNEDNFDGIPEINRAQIIDDILNLARAEYVSYELAIIATQYLTKEYHHLPWRAFFNSYSYLYERFDGHEVGTMLHEYILKLTENLYKKLGFEDSVNDTQLTKTNRQLILSWVCKLNHKDCVDTSKQLFALWRNDTNIFISPNVKSTVLCTALKHGDYDDWNFVWDQYRKSNFESDKIGILNALGCSENATAINQYFNAIFLKDGLIRDQSFGFAFGSIYSAGKFGVNASIEFLTTNYKEIYSRYGEWDSVANLFSNVAMKFSTESEINQLQHFANKTSEDSKELSKSLKTILTDARNNMQFFNKHGVVIKNLLMSPATSSPPSGGGVGSGNSSKNRNPTIPLLILSVITILILAFH